MAEVERERGVVVLTGATGVIGAEVAKGVVAKGNMDLVMVNRSEEKSQELVDTLDLSSGVEVTVVIADLSSIASVNEAIKTILDKYEMIDVIINNAALVKQSLELTDDGLETTFQVNALSYVQLTEGLLPAVKKCAESGACLTTFPRIIHVSSDFSSAALPEDLNEFSKGNEESEFRGRTVYQWTKRANRMIATHYAELFKSDEVLIASYSNHPGISVLASLGFPEGDDTPEECAESILYCALSESVSMQQTGMYFWRDSLKGSIEWEECKRSSDPEANAAIYEHCLSILAEFTPKEEEEAAEEADAEEEAPAEEEEEAAEEEEQPEEEEAPAEEEEEAAADEEEEEEDVE